MTDQPVSDQGQPAKSQRVQHREKRLKAALKANMAKRKAQLRAKSGIAGSGDTTAGMTGPENDNE